MAVAQLVQYDTSLAVAQQAVAQLVQYDTSLAVAQQLGQYDSAFAMAQLVYVFLPGGFPDSIVAPMSVVW